MEYEGLAPSAAFLIAAVLLDALFGDPQVSFHPIRLLGRSLAAFEKVLRRFGLDGYAGGCLLFVALVVTWVVLPAAAVDRLYRWSAWAGAIVHVVVVYIGLALRDLIDHVRAVNEAVRANDAAAARHRISMLVGRDTSRMDVAACARAAIESLAENFVDGYLSAVFWYVLLGVPGLLVFKVASTMDSMVGYKTPRYLRFGWCGARVDDVMNYVPARLAWLIIGLAALPFRKLSARKAWRVGWEQHQVLPGPNPGWSEAAIAGAIQRRLIGPIWKEGALVTEVWIGDAADPPAGLDRADVRRSMGLVITAAFIVLAVSTIVLS